MDAHRPKILFVVPSLKRAGAETQALELVNGLADSRFEKQLLCFEANLDQLERVDVSRVQLHRLARHRKLDLALAAELRRIVRREAIDVVHCTLQISLFFSWLALRGLVEKPALVAAIHTTANKSWREDCYDRVVFRPLLRRCERVIFVCRNQAQHWTTRFPEIAGRAAVIYNGVDTEKFHPDAAPGPGRALRERLSIPLSSQVVSCVAGFREEKGHRFLVDAMREVNGNRVLLLVGDGPMRATVQRLVSSCGLDERVRFLGEVSDVRPVLAASDLTVLASTSVETFSMAMLESMAMAVPVVSTDIGGMREAIEPGETGELVPPGDVPALSAALRRMLDDPERLTRAGRRARECVLARFRREQMIAATATLIEQVHGARATAALQRAGAK